MNSNHFNHPEHYTRLSDRERAELLDQLKSDLNWIETYKMKEPLLRSAEEKKLYSQKSASSALISHRLSQHALLMRNQLAYLLTNTMEIMEIAMDMDPSDSEKFKAYRRLQRSYMKFMRAFKNEFRKN
jgi:hypothetical protein